MCVCVCVWSGPACNATVRLAMKNAPAFPFLETFRRIVFELKYFSQFDCFWFWKLHAKFVCLENAFFGLHHHFGRFKPFVAGIKVHSHLSFRSWCQSLSLSNRSSGVRRAIEQPSNWVISMTSLLDQSSVMHSTDSSLIHSNLIVGFPLHFHFVSIWFCLIISLNFFALFFLNWIIFPIIFSRNFSARSCFEGFTKRNKGSWRRL